mmetsp:Transcript_37649/g.93204  ORF Transcript_37649/g.93204 Transcript_37649/m.93204 type:complete len:150 (-) Transcript_37649:441-890(-)
MRPTPSRAPPSAATMQYQQGVPYGAQPVGTYAPGGATMVPVVNGVPGYYVEERYCGVITILIGVFIFPFVCCCPCDSRQVFVPLHQGAQQMQPQMQYQQQQMQPTQYQQQQMMQQPQMQPMQAQQQQQQPAPGLVQQNAGPSYYPQVKG